MSAPDLPALSVGRSGVSKARQRIAREAGLAGRRRLALKVPRPVLVETSKATRARSMSCMCVPSGEAWGSLGALRGRSTLESWVASSPIPVAVDSHRPIDLEKAATEFRVGGPEDGHAAALIEVATRREAVRWTNAPSRSAAACGERARLLLARCAHLFGRHGARISRVTADHRGFLAPRAHRGCADRRPPVRRVAAPDLLGAPARARRLVPAVLSSRVQSVWDAPSSFSGQTTGA